MSGSSGSGDDARTHSESEWRTWPSPIRVGVTSRTSTRNGDGRAGSVVGIGTAAGRDRVERRALLAGVERRDHREDDLAVLHRAHVAGRERTAVAVAVDVQDHGPVDAARPEEVAVQRVRQAIVGHRRARGAQRLRRDLAAVERHARARAGFVLAAEQVAVEHLEIEQRRELADLTASGCLHTRSRRVRDRGPDHNLAGDRNGRVQ